MNKSQITSRADAAIVIFGFATGSSLFWNNGEIEWISLASNMALGLAGLIALHFRWRARERRKVTPGEAQEVFK